MSEIPKPLRVGTRSRGQPVRISQICWLHILLPLSSFSARGAARMKSEAAVRPLGLSPLLERAGSDRMGVPAQPHGENGLGLVAELLLERAADIAHDRFLVSANSSLRQLRDLARELKGAGENLLSRHDLVGQTDAQRVLGADRPARDDEFHGAPEPDDQRQAHGQAVSCNDVPAALKGAEDGGLRNDPNVGEERGLEARRNRVAVHRRDDGLEDVHLARIATDAGEVVKVPAVSIPILARPLGGIREIPASAEGLSSSRHDEYERIVVVPKALPGVLELRVHPAVDRVALIGPVVGQKGHLVLDRVSDRFIVHLRLLQLVQLSQASLPNGVAVEPGCPPFISGTRSPQKRRGDSDSGGSCNTWSDYS